MMPSEIVTYNFKDNKVILPINHNLEPCPNNPQVYNDPIYFEKVASQLTVFKSKDKPF